MYKYGTTFKKRKCCIIFSIALPAFLLSGIIYFLIRYVCPLAVAAVFLTALIF